ncbi:MAG: beta-ketoacyl synthase chain length factor [Helicobacter sp.]|nr:beta-ketoacyl synthase chain length factor [Helicobacter sp.]
MSNINLGIKQIAMLASNGFIENLPYKNEIKSAFDLSLVPSLERRRLGNAAKCAFTLLKDFDLSQTMPIIFSSFSGEIYRCLDLLKTLKKEHLVSPTSFSLSVLNATSALVAIMTKNHSEISAISADCSLEYGLINAYIKGQPQAIVINYEENLLNQSGEYEYFCLIIHIDNFNYTKYLTLECCKHNCLSYNQYLSSFEFFRHYIAKEKSKWESISNHLKWKWQLV